MLFKNAIGKEAIVSTIEEMMSLKYVGNNYKVIVTDSVRGGTFIFDKDRVSEHDKLTVYNGWVRQYDGDIKINWSGTTGIKDSTIDKFKKVVEFDENKYTDSKIIQVLESNGYGYSGDDGYSSSEYLITGKKIYVSSTTGDDNNDGLSPLTPIKTVYKSLEILNSGNPGDGVLFKRGDVWDEENDYKALDLTGTIDNPYVLGCYGNGDLPRFTSENEYVNDLTWTDEGNGIWSTIPEFSNKKIPNIKINYKYEIASLNLDKLVDMPVISWYHDYTNDKLYINLDPTEIHSFIFPKIAVFFTFINNSKFIFIDRLNIEETRQYSIVGYTNTDNIIVQNCILGKHTMRGVSLNGTNIMVINNLIDGCEEYYSYNKTGDTTYPNGSYEGVVINFIDGVVNNTLIVNNTIKNWRHASVMNNGITTDDYTSGLTIKKNICYIDKNVIQYGGRIDIQKKTIDVNIIDNIFLYANAMQLEGYNIKVSDNMFYKTVNSSSASKITNVGYPISPWFGSDGLGLDNLSIVNNIFFKADGVGVKYIGSAYNVTKNTKINSNIFYDNCLDGYPWYENDPGTGVQLYVDTDNKLNMKYPIENTEIKNNILWSNLSTTVIVAGSSYIAGDYVSVLEAESLSFTDGTMMQGNLQIDLKQLLEE